MTGHPAVNRLARLLDWRFLVALAFLLLVAFVLVGGYQANMTKERRIDALIERAERQDAALAQRAQEASQEREDLTRQIDRLEQRQAALLAYLRGLGVDPPPEVLESPSANKNPPRAAAPATPIPVPREQERPPRAQAPGPTLAAPPPVPSPRRPTPVQDLLDDLLKGPTP